MHTYSTVQKMNYSAQQMFSLVGDVEKYPHFLPWCEALRIKSCEEGEIIADMVVAFKGISEKFTSRVFLDSDTHTITVQYEDGPFKSLNNVWVFVPIDDNTCEIHFNIEFAFRNKILDTLLKPVFFTIVEKMIGAFQSRADDLYS